MTRYNNLGVQKASELLHQANVNMLENWLTIQVFSWRWWFLLALALGVWAGWIKWHHKESTARLLFGGFIILLLSYYMDAIGVALGLWSYPCELLPLIPPYLAWDFCVMPVISMISFQIRPKLNPIIKAISLGVLGSYIVQPIAVIMGWYHLRYWRHTYSFILVVVFYLLGYFFYNGRKFRNQCR